MKRRGWTLSLPTPAQPMGTIRRRGGVTSAFSPPDIAGLAAWYSDAGPFWGDDARTLPASGGGTVGAWDDISGNGRHLLQASAAKPTYQLGVKNGRSIVRFDGADDFLRATFTLAQPVTAFVVFKAPGPTVTRYVLDGATGTPGVNCSIMFQTTTQLRLYAGSSLLTGSADFAFNNWYVENHLASGSSSDIRLNGVLKGGPAAAGSNGMGGVTLGATSGGSAWGACDIGEALFYAAALSTTDRQSVETYLNGRWAVY